MAWASRGALLRAANGISGGSAGRRSLAVGVSTLRLSSPLSSTTTTGHYHAAVPTCRSDRRSHRRPLPSATIISPPDITVGTCTSPRLMSSSSAAAQYFEGPWYEKYLLLEQYKKDHGNCLVPHSFVYGDIKLGIWIGNQRELYKKGKLSQNRRELLDALGFSWNPLADRWERNFALLEDYKKREGHSNAPKSYEEDGVNLGEWLNTQRMAMKRGKLDESYQRRLEELGVSFDPHRDQWERNFALLEQFKDREGHCNVPVAYKEDGASLGSWVDSQRTAMKRGKLNESYQRRLEDLGFSFDPLGDQWERNFALLEEYKKREGHSNAPISYEEDGIKLGMWLTTQRMSMKRGKLDESYQRRLEDLGVSRDPYADQWERNFAMLEGYKKREGHSNAPISYDEDGVNLGVWLKTQRMSMKRGKLNESYQRRLEELGISWDPLADQWERNFALLEQFKDREGHCNVPQSYEEDGIKLGMWLDNVRLARKGKRGYNLSTERIERLEKLGVLWDTQEEQWERNFVLLKRYKEREGHCNVPQSHEEDGVKLGKWLHNIRQARKRKRSGNSSLERIARLGVLGIRW